MSRRLALAVVTVLTVSLSHAGTGAPCPEAKHLSKPEMSLKLSAYHGMRPMELELAAQISLPSPESMKSCWIQAEWKNTTGVGLPFQTRDESPCAGERAEVKVPESFRKTFVLDKAGAYSYRIILEDYEGKRYASATREVKVFERGELRLGATVGEN